MGFNWVFFCGVLVFQISAFFIFLFPFLLNAESEKNIPFEKFKSVLKNSQPKSVEEFLPAWKQTSPEFFKKYLVGYRSRSLQSSSFLSPRIILFSEKTDLVITFNGDAQHRGFNDLEVMAFNYQTDAFEFYEVDASVFKTGELSTPNPKKCLECHQSAARSSLTSQNKIDPRPNWEPYNTWPGFYGSLDDDMSPKKMEYSSVINAMKNNPADQILIDEFSQEEKYFELFKTQAKSHPRYQYLEPIEPRSTYSYDKTVNVEFTKKLSILNFRRVARLMAQEKEVFDFVKWNIARYVQCGMAPLTDEVRSQMDPLFATEKYPRSLTFSSMIDLTFKALAVDTEDWSMDFKTQGGRFGIDRFASPNESWVEFRPGYEKYFLAQPDLTKLSCSEINEQAAKRFDHLENLKKFQLQRLQKSLSLQPQPLIQRCVDCHSSYDLDIPSIPFENEAALTLALKKEGYKRGTLLDEIKWRIGDHVPAHEQMPPRGVPTLKQRQDLIQYLESLK